MGRDAARVRRVLNPLAAAFRYASSLVAHEAGRMPTVGVPVNCRAVCWNA
jgi:hypothetical protein